jgi:hypothetical protein
MILTGCIRPCSNRSSRPRASSAVSCLLRPVVTAGLRFLVVGLGYAAFDELELLGGTFCPFWRASESPIAIACLRLLTFPPLPRLPERSVPLFLRRIALATVLLAPLLYLRLDLFLAGIFPPAI